MDLLKSVELEQQKQTKPSIKVGDTVKVHVKIKEEYKERVQIFEGVVIKIQNGGVNQTFTVRKLSYGIGVEKTFLINSPLIVNVETVRKGIVHRAKLTYLRDRIGKATKVKEKIFIKDEFNSESQEDVVETIEDTVVTEEAKVEEQVASEVKTEEVVETVAEEVATPTEEVKTEEQK